MFDYNKKWNTAEAWEWFTNLCKTPKKVQQDVLMSILKNGNESEWGKTYSFSTINSIEEFQNRVPITTWSDYEDASLRMQQGEDNILFNGAPKVFIMTSGTAGSPKLIPETTLGIQAKSITEKIKQNFTLAPYPAISKGKILPLVNGITLGKTSSGIPFGTASGLTLLNTSEQLKKMFAYPIDVLKIEDSDAMDYALIRFALDADVRLIIGNNITRMEKLINVAINHAEMIYEDIKNGTLSEHITIEKDLREKLLATVYPNPKRAEELHSLRLANQFIPKGYWRNLNTIACWLSGSVGSSVPTIKKYFSDETIYLDCGYGATEGKFNIPHQPNRSHGPLTVHAAFYEFSPVDNPNLFLQAHQLEIGNSYNLIVTNFSGLYRYNMHDIIRVEAFYKDTPEICFISKSGDIGNICGEKLAGTTIAKVARDVALDMNIELKHICALPSSTPPHYIFYVEFAPNTQLDLEMYKQQLDDALKKDLGYKNKRRDNLLRMPEIKVMPNGWLESLYQEKESQGISRAQLKLPVICKTPPTQE